MGCGKISKCHSHNDYDSQLDFSFDPPFDHTQFARASSHASSASSGPHVRLPEASKKAAAKVAVSKTRDEYGVLFVKRQPSVSLSQPRMSYDDEMYDLNERYRMQCRDTGTFQHNLTPDYIYNSNSNSSTRHNAGHYVPHETESCLEKQANTLVNTVN